MTKPHASCEVWIDGTLAPCTVDDLKAGIPTVLDQLVINWGRQGSYDQPDIGTCTLTIRDESASQDALEYAHVGAQVLVYASGEVPPPGGGNPGPVDAVNVVSNPAVESGDITGYSTATPARYPVLVDSSQPIWGDYSVQALRTDDTINQYQSSSQFRGMADGSRTPVTEGVPTTWSVDVRVERSSRQVYGNVTFYDAGGVALGNTGTLLLQDNLVPGEVYRVSLLATPRGGAVGASWQVEVVAKGGGNAEVGERAWFDRFQVTPEAGATSALSATNFAVNPSLEGGTDLGWYSNNGTLYPAVVDNTSAMTGTYSLRTTRTSDMTSGNTTAGSIYIGNGSGWAGYPVTPGVPVTISLDVKCDQPNRKITGSIQWLDASSIISSTTSVTLVADTGAALAKTRPVISGTPPAGALTCRVILGVYVITGTVVAGERVWFDQVGVRNDGGTGYFDGDSTPSAGYWFKWTGTRKASTSQRYMATTGSVLDATNMLPTPVEIGAVGTDAAYFNAYATNTGAATLKVDSSTYNGRPVMRCQSVGTPTTNRLGIRTNRLSNDPAIPAGATFRFSADVFISADFPGKYVAAVFRDDPNNDSNATTIIGTNGRVVPGGVWTRVEFQATVKPGRTVSGIYIDITTNGQGNAPVGSYTLTSNWLIQQDAPAGAAYFDGNSLAAGSSWFRWSGTAGKSPSQRYTTGSIPDATNLAANPGFESGLIDGYVSNVPARYPVTVDTAVPISGTASGLSTRTSDTPSNVVGSWVCRDGALNFPVTAGSPVTASIDIRAELASRRVQVSFQWFDSLGTMTTGVATIPVSGMIAGQVYRVINTDTPPAGIVAARLKVDVLTPTGNATTGERVWFDRFNFGGADYFDGDTPSTGGYWYRWTGTPRASSSQRMLTQPHTVPVIPYFDGDTEPDDLHGYRWRGAHKASASERFTWKPGGVNIIQDNGWEGTPPGALAHDRYHAEAGSPTLIIQGNQVAQGQQALQVSGTGTFTVIFPPLPFLADGGNPTAWDSVPQIFPGESWTHSLMIKLPPGGTAKLVAAPLSTPYVSGAGASTATTPDTPTTGGWQLLEGSFTSSAPGPVWLAVGVTLTLPAPRAWSSAELATEDWTQHPEAWQDYALAFIDELTVLSPDETTRRVLVFAGQVTDVSIEPVNDHVIEASLTAADVGSALENDVVGDVPWPSQTVQERADMIAGMAHLKLPVTIDPGLKGTMVSYRDVDAQPVLALLQDLAQSVGAPLWTATHGNVGSYFWMEDLDQRAAVHQLAMDKTQGQIMITPADRDDVGVISAMDILRDPVRLTSTVREVITMVVVSWLEQGMDDGDPPQVTTTDRYVTVVDQAAADTYGRRRLSISTELTHVDDAEDLASKLLAMSRRTSWLASGYTMDTARVRDSIPTVDDDDRQLAFMDLLDGSTRIGKAVTLIDLPSWMPADVISSMYVEGGTYTWADGAWRLELIISPAQGQGESVEWRDLPTGWQWNQWDEDIRWTDLYGVAGP